MSKQYNPDKQICSWNDHRDQIKSMKYLEKGWDTYDADPITDIAINNAIKEINDLERSGFDFVDVWVQPTSMGSVLIEATDEYEIRETDCFNDGEVVTEIRDLGEN